MNDALIDRANPPPRDSRRASCQNRFERYSPTSCRLVDGIISGLTVAYLASDLLQAAVAANATEELVNALLCARRIASDEGFDAGRETVRSGIRSLLGLSQEATKTEEVLTASGAFEE